MRANIQLNDPAGLQGLKKHTAVRTVMGLPMFIVLRGTRHSALLCNLSHAGAKIDTSAPLMIEDMVEFHCGSIWADGVVLWRGSTTFGIEFARPIDEKQLIEQVARSAAIAQWRKARPSIITEKSLQSLHQNSSAD